MKFRLVIVVGACAVLLVGVAALAVLGGVFVTSRDTHPPCEELPTRAEAAAGLARHRALADEIEALGKGVSVRVGTPCSDGQDRALIEVTYGSDAQRDAIRDLLARRDGFGVPVHLVAD